MRDWPVLFTDILMLRTNGRRNCGECSTSLLFQCNQQVAIDSRGSFPLFNTWGFPNS